MKTAKALRAGLVGEGEFIANPDNREPAKRAAREAAAIARNQLELANIECHKAHLAREHGLERNAKFNAAYSIAWDQGHSSGFNEVANYFSDLLPLFKETDLARLKAERDELREALVKLLAASEHPKTADTREIVMEIEAEEQARAVLARTEPK